MNKYIKNQGFTLVELITVIIILAIIAATAVPVMLNFSKDARISRLKSIAGALTEIKDIAYLHSVLKGKDGDHHYMYDENIVPSKPEIMFGYPYIYLSRHFTYWLNTNICFIPDVKNQDDELNLDCDLQSGTFQLRVILEGGDSTGSSWDNPKKDKTIIEDVSAPEPIKCAVTYTQPDIEYNEEWQLLSPPVISYATEGC